MGIPDRLQQIRDVMTRGQLQPPEVLKICADLENICELFYTRTGPFADRPLPTLDNVGLRYTANDYPWDGVVQIFAGQPRWMPASYGSLAVSGWEDATFTAPQAAFNYRFGVRTSPHNFDIATVAGQPCNATAFNADGSASGYMWFGGWAVCDINVAPIESGTIVQTAADGSMIALAGGTPLGVVFGYGAMGFAANVWLFV